MKSHYHHTPVKAIENTTVFIPASFSLSLLSFFYPSLPPVPHFPHPPLSVLQLLHFTSSRKMFLPWTLSIWVIQELSFISTFSWPKLTFSVVDISPQLDLSLYTHVMNFDDPRTKILAQNTLTISIRVSRLTQVLGTPI